MPKEPIRLAYSNSKEVSAPTNPNAEWKNSIWTNMPYTIRVTSTRTPMKSTDIGVSNLEIPTGNSGWKE